MGERINYAPVIGGWKKIRHRLEYAGVRLLARLVPKLSRAAAVRLSQWLGDLAFKVDRRGRAVALANLECAFGSAMSPARRRHVARLSYRTFARTMLDLFWSSRINEGNWRDYIQLENVEPFAQAVSDGRGALFLLSHHGDFEWAHLSVSLAGYGGIGVQETFKNPLLTRLFSELRGRGGTIVVEQDRSVLRFYKHLKRGGTAGVLIDLTLRPSQMAAVVESFGMKMCVSSMHAELHRRLGVPLFVIENIPLADGRCRVTVHGPFEYPPEMGAAEITQACWDRFEEFIRERPEYWMWAYKHWRFRPESAERPYPFYANRSSAFEKLLSRHAQHPAALQGRGPRSAESAPRSDS
jgi:KDO2-lipid IV(A) lauroyltransferase